MDEIILNLIVLGCLLFLTGLTFFIIKNRQSRETQSLIKFARQNGWQLKFIKEPLAKGVRITSPEWSLETIKRSSGREAGPGSSNIEQFTTWYADLPGTTILIGQKFSNATNIPSMELIIKQLILNAIGEEAKDLTEVKIGTSAFQNQFMVWAKDVYEAETILSPALQSALVSWKKGNPLIKRTSKGITIELRDAYLKKPEEILTLVQLGKKLL